MMAQIDTLLKDNLELQTKCRKLNEQVGSTAKPTLKSKTVYQRKPNLTQKSLNTMFHDQITSLAATSPASTQSAPSPIVSTATASPTTDKSNENTSKIPLKRALSATLSDKTNSRVSALIQDSKEKGRAVEVKHEQVDVDASTALENVPDQAVHTAKDTSAIRKKPKNNTSITAVTGSTVRRTVQSTSAPTTPATCNTSHRKDRSNMIGGTCTACVNVSTSPCLFMCLCSISSYPSFTAPKQLLQTLMDTNWN
ncbi:hypothetical protein FB192DRAFT_1072679 [Mucor lusitanicus]|uniref:Uncharacterized protein n=1 Tax=Mucor circinelloides f. lusitanicus TaxID=29924 RepID=A0A8H4F437_MUCCL|nr:hypothetical protein FB192DRAFT_1072679 [Mucor lusitanicus]